MLDIIEYGYEHLVLSHSKGGTIVVTMGAVVDNSIHIKLYTETILVDNSSTAMNEGSLYI